MAVGSEPFVGKVKGRLKGLAIGRRIHSTTTGWELREEAIPYNRFLEAQKVDLAPENTYSWNESDVITR